MWVALWLQTTTIVTFSFGADESAQREKPTNYRPCNDEMKYGVLRKSGDAFYADGLKDEAAKCYEIAVRIHTQDSFALFRLGNLARERRDLRPAAEWYMKALVHAHNMSEAHNNLGITYSELGRSESALTSFERALKHNPTLADAHYNRANVLKEQGKLATALVGYHTAVRLAPTSVSYYNNLALAHMAGGDYRAAVETCDTTLRIDPKYSTAHYNLANALLEVGNLEMAVKAYQSAIKVNPAEAEYHHNLAFTYERMRKPKEAVFHLRRANKLKNDFVEAQCNLVDLLHGTADWRSTVEEQKKLVALIDTKLEENPTQPPVTLPRGLRCAAHLPSKLLLELSQAQAAAMEESVSMAEPFEHPTTLAVRDGPDEILRVGYAAAGFAGGSAVSHLAGLFVGHSHAGHSNTAQGHLGMEVRCFSLLPGGRNSETEKINKWLNSRWIDVSQVPIVEAAQKIHNERVHILVSVDGFASAERTPVLAMRPAPIQVGYRSHPGSVGAEWLDYGVGDSVSTPPSDGSLTPEKMAMMPFSAYINDYWRLRREHDLAPMRVGDREDYGLPMKRFVLMHLGLYGRIDIPTWRSWGNVLGRLPNATLWMLRATNDGQEHLEGHLKAAGVDIVNKRSRVRFSDPVGREEHVRRSGLGDVHLDTPLHNGHTMVVETMWAGTPCVTMPLDSTPRRVSTSALHATGLGPIMAELGATTRKEYEDLVVELARKEPKKPAMRRAPQTRMFDLVDWVGGGLNPLMQKHSTKGRELVSPGAER